MPFSSFLRGKVAMITGGGGTIGQAIASKLVGHGASVILVGRSLQRLEEGRANILRDSLESNVRVFSCDVTKEESVADLFHQVGRSLQRVETAKDEFVLDSIHSNISVFSCDVTKEENVVDLFGQVDAITSGKGVDLLINNAGIAINGETETLSGSDFSSVMNVNVVGPFLCAREALKRMKVRQKGRIINIGSISAISPRPDSAPYTTSKFAIMGLTQSLALDARQYCNVAVGMIHPGNVVSAIMGQEEAERRGKMEGFLQPEDVGDCVLNMASLPYSANVLEMTVIPTRQPLVGRG